MLQRGKHIHIHGNHIVSWEIFIWYEKRSVRMPPIVIHNLTNFMNINIYSAFAFGWTEKWHAKIRFAIISHAVLHVPSFSLARRGDTRARTLNKSNCFSGCARMQKQSKNWGNQSGAPSAATCIPSYYLCTCDIIYNSFRIEIIDKCSQPSLIINHCTKIIAGTLFTIIIFRQRRNWCGCGCGVSRCRRRWMACLLARFL